MRVQPSVIEGTAKEVMAELAHIPEDAPVRLVIGRPSLSIVARRLQREAEQRGMTAEIHDELLRSLKNNS